MSNEQQNEQVAPVVTETSCMLTPGCIGEAGHAGVCVPEGEVSHLNPLGIQTEVVSTFDPNRFSEPKPIPTTDLKSRDGLPIPDEGITFSVVYGPEGEEQRGSIRLHQALVGLNVRVGPGSNQSQAQTFASFGVQAGYSDESEMLADPEISDYLNLVRNRQGEIFCRANRAITVLETRAIRSRNAKARDTMNSDGRLISPNQRDEAWRMVGVAKEAGLHDAAAAVMVWLQKPSGTRGISGSLAYDIGEINLLLDEMDPTRRQDRKKAQAARRASNDSQSSDQPVTGQPKRF